MLSGNGLTLFNKIIEVMADAAKHDEEMGWEERFEFELVD